jgi:hypothetical protein
MAARLRALPAATFRPRFFVARFFGGRVVRCAREFGAMTPPTLAGPTMPRPGLESHAEAGFSPATGPESGQADEAADVGRRSAPGAQVAQAGRLS